MRRNRHSIAGRKSDHGDAFVLANVLRTDARAHCRCPADSYERRRADGGRHTAAERNLFGRLLGCLHHCLFLV